MATAEQNLNMVSETRISAAKQYAGGERKQSDGGVEREGKETFLRIHIRRKTIRRRTPASEIVRGAG